GPWPGPGPGRVRPRLTRGQFPGLSSVWAMAGAWPRTCPLGTCSGGRNLRRVAEFVAYAADGWGVGELWFENGALAWHELPRPKADAPPGAAPASRSKTHPLAERMAAYFEGDRAGFADVGLDLSWCTPFQRAVAEALRAVPYGETVTYGELAALAGHP